MSAPRRIAASLALALFSGPAAAQEQQDPPYISSENPLTSRQLKLLIDNNFLPQSDGTIRQPSNSEPVHRSEMPYLVQRLESAQRLKTLLKLNIILNKSEGEKNLAPGERESIREVVRENWPVLTYSIRKNFKSYFSLQELEQLDANLPAAIVSAMPLKDPYIPELPATSPPPPPTILVASAVIPAAMPAAMPAVLPSVLIPAAPPSPPPPPPPPPPTTADLGVMKPWNPSQAPAAPIPAPTPVTILPPPAAAAEASTSSFIFGQGPAPAPPPPPAPPPVAPITPVEAPAPAAAARPIPGLDDITPVDLEKFLLQAPYGRDAKAMIRLISEHAPAPARKRALNTLRFALPQVSLDPSRAQEALRSRLEAAPTDGQIPSIILRPAVTIYERKRLFLATVETLLPDSAKGFEEAGLPAPALNALSREAPSRDEKTEWGQTRFFEDGSRRATFTLEQQAGLLLAELLRLDVSLRGQNASLYDTEIFARTAQMLFYARLQSVLSSDRFLDPELRLDLRRWIDYPSEYRDHLFHSLNFGRPSRKIKEVALAAYESTGLFDSAQIDEARRRLPVATAGAEEITGQSKSSLILSEMLGAERQFRQEREVPDEKKN